MSDSDEIKALDPTKVFYTVDCPYCRRIEDIEDQGTAMAWTVLHIQEQHPEELPEL